MHSYYNDIISQDFLIGGIRLNMIITNSGTYFFVINYYRY